MITAAQLDAMTLDAANRANPFAPGPLHQAYRVGLSHRSCHLLYDRKTFTLPAHRRAYTEGWDSWLIARYALLAAGPITEPASPPSTPPASPPGPTPSTPPRSA